MTVASILNGEDRQMPWKNPEDRRAYCRNRYATDVDFRQASLARGATRYQNQKERIAANSRRRNRRLKIETIQHYGGHCACCGETIIEFLAIDHESGHGNQHRKETGCNGGVIFFRWLKSHHWPAGFRVLCHNCNMAIGSWGFCPHQNHKEKDNGSK